MFNQRQCEIARLLTATSTPDTQINEEYQSVGEIRAKLSTQMIDVLLKEHDLPFDEGFEILKEDFLSIAQKFSISPATLFCIYMHYVNQRPNE